MSVHWSGKWVVICSDDEQSATMTRDDALRYATELDECELECGPHRIARVTSTGNIIGEPQAPKGKGRT